MSTTRVVKTPSGIELDELCINTIRTLSIDAVQAANSGHPGTPMALAPLVYTLWNRVMHFDPKDPIWPNRDRFVLSNGHASMLLWSALHLTKTQAVNAAYETLGKPSVSLDDIRHFRQLDSKAPGHPEYHWVSGVETTTGPLGQGVATSVGMAISQKWLANRFNKPGFDIFDYRIYAVWSLSGQHTGLTDLPLTEHGKRNAIALGERLKGLTFAKVYTSPLQRASLTCKLAGFGDVAEVDRDLLEWNYGQYEGLTSAEIHSKRPDWQLFRDGCPGGESPEQVGARADRVVRQVRAVNGDVLLFSSGHFLRVLGARWLGLQPSGGRYFLLSTASLSSVGYEHNLSQPVIRLWNDTRHVSA